MGELREGKGREVRGREMREGEGKGKGRERGVGKERRNVANGEDKEAIWKGEGKSKEVI